MSLRDELLEYRAEKNLTQREAAERFGCSMLTWKLWENEKQTPTSKNETKLKKFLKK